MLTRTLLQLLIHAESGVALRKFAKPCTKKPEPEAEQDEDHPSIHLEKTAIADGFTKVLPQGMLFDPFYSMFHISLMI